MSNRREIEHLHENMERLNAMLDAKKADYVSALKAGDVVLAEKMREEAEAMIVEMRMVNPVIALSQEEELMLMWSQIMTKDLHNNLNKKNEGPTK